MAPMNQKLRELEIKALRLVMNGDDPDRDVDRMYIPHEYTKILAELVVRECAEWMRDGNIPDGFYEAGRLLEHFGIEE